MAPKKSEKPSKESPKKTDSGFTTGDSFFDDIIEDLEKFGGVSADIGMRYGGLECESMALDYALGGNGIPYGQFTTITGDEDTGKSTIALLYGIAAVKNDMKVAVFNREARWNIPYAERSGMGKANKNYLLLFPDTAESALEGIRTCARHNVDVCILESIAALAPRAEMNGTMDTQTIGVFARTMAKFFRDAVLEVAAANMAVIMTNQYREKIGVIYGSPKTAPGGKAKDFFSTVDIRLNSPLREYAVEERNKEGKKTGEKYETVGMTINGYTKKSAGVNNRQIKFHARFVPGLHVNRYAETLDFGLKLGLFSTSDGSVKVKRAGSWIFEDKKLGGTYEDAQRGLNQDTDLFLELSDRIRTEIRTGRVIKTELGEKDDDDEE